MMRYMFLPLILFVLFFSGIACNTPDQNSTVEPKEPSHTAQAAETRIYEVFGMDCPGCHGGLEKLVNKIPAVQNSKANWKKKQLVVTIKSEAKLNDEDINDAIKRANLTQGSRIK